MVVVAQLRAWPRLSWFGPLAVGGGSFSLGLSSGGGEVRHQDPLCLERGLVPWWLVWLSRGGRLLVGKLASPLRCLMLGIGLLSAGSRLLPLP
jgi:hypothetical protein